MWIKTLGCHLCLGQLCVLNQQFHIGRIIWTPTPTPTHTSSPPWNHKKNPDVRLPLHQLNSHPQICLCTDVTCPGIVVFSWAKKLCPLQPPKPRYDPLQLTRSVWVLSFSSFLHWILDVSGVIAGQRHQGKHLAGACIQFQRLSLLSSWW